MNNDWIKIDARMIDNQRMISWLMIIISTQLVFSQSTDFLARSIYGPSLHDPIIIQKDIDIHEWMNQADCNTVLLEPFKEMLHMPGPIFPTLTYDQSEQIMACALSNDDALPLLHYLVYSQQLNQQHSDENSFLRLILYHPEYIQVVSKKYPKILSVIPDSHPNYIDIVIHAMNHSPRAFNYVTLRYKRHDKITHALFHLKETYDDVYKHLAIQYTTNSHQIIDFLMHNGQLYRELSSNNLHNPLFAYHAYIQNDAILPYIPSSVSVLFTDGKTPYIPRYKTFILLKINAMKHRIHAFFKPIIQWFMVPPNQTITIKTTDDSTETHGNGTPIPFTIERTVVNDTRIINKIEVKKKRRLLNLWRIATIDEGTSIYIAMFRSIGNQALGSIVIHVNQRMMFSDYPVIFSPSGDSIWRVGDNGEFHEAMFKVASVVENKDNQLDIRLRWDGDYTVNEFVLTDKSGRLIRNFINYHFQTLEE